jgi:hypothetical protein
MEAKYPSKERVERDGVLVYAEGDELLNDPDEAQRQGYDVDDELEPKRATERVERDGVLVYAEGDVIDETADDEPEEPKSRKAGANKAMKPATNK